MTRDELENARYFRHKTTGGKYAKQETLFGGKTLLIEMNGNQTELVCFVDCKSPCDTLSQTVADFLDNYEPYYKNHL